MAKRLIPSFNRILVEKIIPPSKTTSGILLPEKTSKLNSGKIVAVGPGARDKDGKFIPLNLKEGDTVLLPEYGGTEIKLGEKDSGLRIVSFWVSGLFEFELGLSIQNEQSIGVKMQVMYHLYRDDDILGTLHE
ncbi:10 kDa chaperonin-like [Gossypium australe]|uniref:10 kDa chaperonin-like n=3 Tax=Gossypium TaxID=3633 RepID=A0A5B6VRK9_9ROSI|nr:10 kDa chaperonin-like [Gossypium australe]